MPPAMLRCSAAHQLARHLSYRQIIESVNAFDPSLVEVQSGLGPEWHQRGLFNPDTQPNARKDLPPFVLCLPPPNVTGDLHIGHASALAIEDALGRWHRMRGHRVLLVPGTDHAGIATQVVVERLLEAEGGPGRREMGRQAFVERTWRWSEEKRTVIRRQMDRLGVSADWSREYFTLSPAMSGAVRRAFRRLQAAGQIHRGSRAVSWCCALRSALSDVEVEWREVGAGEWLPLPAGQGRVRTGLLHRLAYPLVAEPGDHPAALPVATTRPETILGDTAVAVHPRDPRLAPLIGRRVRHPILGHELPVVGDEEVEMERGTGAVKLTPGHSAVDLAIARRHSLPVVNILNEDGTLNENAGPFQGMPRAAAREAVLDAMAAQGLYEGSSDHPHAVPLCSRTGDLLEPVVRPQWFVRCSGAMAERALHAVESGELLLRPAGFVGAWRNWLSHCEDWCISRQLWWGHRIPAWYRQEEDGEVSWKIPVNDEEEKFLRESSEWHQDEDVLDTWFSAALLPFSCLGWPDSSHADFARFFPTSVLETGHDILFFWVARMVMLGLQLTDRLPFREVVLHGLVCDEQGQKMSKSRGNVIDPLSLVEARGQLEANVEPNVKSLGADALRLALLSYNARPLQINFSEKEVLKHRKFLNKVWHTLRFGFAQIEPSNVDLSDAALAEIDPQNLPLIERWLLARLSRLVTVSDSAMRNRELHLLCDAVPHFWREDLSSVFIPVTRMRSAPRLRQQQQQVFCLALDVCLRLLHPAAPFATDFAWRALREARQVPESDVSLSVASFPRPEAALWQRGGSGEDEEEAMAEALRVCRVLNRWRQLGGVLRQSFVCLECESPVWLQELSPLVAALSKVSVRPPGTAEAQDCLSLPLVPRVALQLAKDTDLRQLEQVLRRRVGKMEAKRRAMEAAQRGTEMEQLDRDIAEVTDEIAIVQRVLVSSS